MITISLSSFLIPDLFSYVTGLEFDSLIVDASSQALSYCSHCVKGKYRKPSWMDYENPWEDHQKGLFRGGLVENSYEKH